MVYDLYKLCMNDPQNDRVCTSTNPIVAYFEADTGYRNTVTCGCVPIDMFNIYLNDISKDLYHLVKVSLICKF